MSLPSGKLFVPDQAIYWLDPKAKLDKPINKRDWLQTHHLPEFVEDPKKDEKSPWTRIDRIEARTEFLKNLGSAGDASKRKLLCFTASAGVGKSIALDQIAYLRSLDPEHVVIRYHFSELPINPTHFKLAGESERREITTGKTKTLVTALLKTIFPLERKDPSWPKLTDTYEKAMLQWIELKIAQGQATLIVDGLDELNADLKSETGAPGSNRAEALSQLLYDGVYTNLHCVVAGRPYSIVNDNWIHLFHFDDLGLQKHGGSEWEFCLAALFTEAQSKRYLGPRYDKLGSLLSQTPLTPRHLEVIRTLPGDRFANLHSLACVYWEMLQASLEKDLTREGNVGPFERLDVPVTKEQYIGYLAALASITMKRSKDLKTLDLAEHEVILQNRVLKIPSWKIGKETTEEKIKHIKGLNSSSIEFNYLRQSNSQVVWKDRTVMDFFAALWLVRYSTDQQREVVCKQVPRRGEKLLHETRRDLWTFIAGMPFDAFEKFDNLRRDERWLRLAHRLFQPFPDAKRPTQLMYIAWEELKRGIRDEDRKESVTQVMESFTKKYQGLIDAGSDASTIIEEDLIFVPIEPLDNGSWNVAVGDPYYVDDPHYLDNKPKRIELCGPYSVSKFPITRRLYKLFDCNHEVHYRDDFEKYCSEQRCPVIRVNWFDAQMFAIWSESRLLTEWEWEYACRANRRSEDHHKQELEYLREDRLDDRARDIYWFHSGASIPTWPVDAKTSHTNSFGLVDMQGNVFEWTDSVLEGGEFSRVFRGGSPHYNQRYAPPSERSAGMPSVFVGFRVARAP